MRNRSLVVLALLGLSVLAFAQSDLSLLSTKKWREIGPWRGGRSCAVTGVYGKPNEFYGGFTGGGVWKTTDAGITWKCVSDGFFKTGSVGALAVSESNPEIVVAGMGETEIRGNISPGDGVYRSMDGGKTWSHIGLTSTQSISRVRIDPKNPDIIWVAALGHIYGPHADRGVFKTTDGGKNWKKVLYVDDRSGAVDLIFDPSNSKVAYAATWTAWRTPYSLNSGGPGSRIYKTTDGGDTWVNISGALGLPTGVLGKIGLSVSPANPNRIYAMIEAKDGGLYRSEDGGATWKMTSNNPDLRQRPWYYTRVYTDPKSADNVWVLNVSILKSTNGGERFSQSNARHSDNHDLWIDPADSNRMIAANDGGITVSTDGGRTWTDQDIPTAQFYHVSTDNAVPYRILGAQQDNSTVRIASRTNTGGIGRADWTSTAGGESGYVVAKPDDPDVVAGGSYSATLDLMNHRTGLSRNINPWPDDPMGAGAESVTHRFQWTFPIMFDHFDSNTMYTCSQHVLKSTDLGGSWVPISPDLTTNDKSKQQSSGGPITKDNTSVEFYCTVFALAQSKLNKNLLWAGSDDGLVHVTRDGGKSWKNVTPKTMPKNGLVSIIEASHHAQGTAYIAVDNHENDDWTPYLFKTTDFGATWQRMSAGIAPTHFTRVIREDPSSPNVLFAGTEFGIYCSTNGGDTWNSIQLNLPIVPIHDLAIKEDDLIAATHGRSFWVLDDISAIRELHKVSRSAPALLSPKPVVVLDGFGGPRGPRAPVDPSENMGENPVPGSFVQLYSPSDVADVKLEVYDKKGTLVGTTSRDVKAGMNAIPLPSLRYPSFKGFTGMRMWGGGPSTLKAPPGEYEIRAKVGAANLKTTGIWKKDPRTTASDADLVRQFELSVKVAKATDDANRAVEKIRAVRSEIQKQIEGDAGLTADAAKLIAGLTTVEEALYQTKAQSGQDFLNFPIRLNNKLATLLGVIQDGQYGPTKQSELVFAELNAKLQVQLKALNSHLGEGLRELNAKLVAKGKSAVNP